MSTTEATGQQSSAPNRAGGANVVPQPSSETQLTKNDTSSREIPYAALESTIPFLQNPYRYISETCQGLGSDVFYSRLMLSKAIFMTGPEATALFYDQSRFKRHGAMATRILNTLLGQEGVQTLDGDPHKYRKGLFMKLMSRENIVKLIEITNHWLCAYANSWAAMPEVVLYGELHEVLTRAAFAWAGVPLKPDEVKQRIGEVAALFDGAGAVGPRHWRARQARRSLERYIEGLVQEVRNNRFQAQEGSILEYFATCKDFDGQELKLHTAAVEILNMIRPTVAVSVYQVFVAHAIYKHPECCDKLNSSSEYLHAFVQEVRRFYPFFPGLMAFVAETFEWKGYQFPKDTLVVIDIHGTNHDKRTFAEPETFNPERFVKYDDKSNAFSFIPQGGGDPNIHHRCAGEMITLDLMKLTARFFSSKVSFDVQDASSLEVDETRVPALPRSGFVIKNVRYKFLNA